MMCVLYPGTPLPLRGLQQRTIVMLSLDTSMIKYHKCALWSPVRSGDGHLSQGTSSVPPLPQPRCSADACTEAPGSEDEEGSQGLLIDELHDEILEHVMYQLRQGMSDCSH